tara:strand:- start:22 stop:354 length:333 start_codon:yes stop_codon:yes gene_type:complete
MEKIQIVRLTTGEELLAKATVNEDKTTITIKDVAILIPAGEGKLAFAPWCPYSDVADGVEIGMEHIMFTASPQSELEQQYISAISGLAVPQEKKIATPGDFMAGDLKLTK